MFSISNLKNLNKIALTLQKYKTVLYIQVTN